jgi:tetratricopeptide (TPR) repeat protein
MQRLVAGEISKERDVVAALKELLSMEDFSHGCLEIFAPSVKGLIGISDSREIIAAQVSSNGPTGLKALRLLLTVKAGRYAFREGYRVSGSQGLSIRKEDLEALIKGFSNADTGDMPEANGTGTSPETSDQSSSSAPGNAKTRKGVDAVARMKAAIQTRTGTNFPAIRLEEKISTPEPISPAVPEENLVKSYRTEPPRQPTPVDEIPSNHEETSAASEPAEEPVKPNKKTWSDLLSDNNVSAGRARPSNVRSEAEDQTEPSGADEGSDQADLEDQPSLEIAQSKPKEEAPSAAAKFAQPQPKSTPKEPSSVSKIASDGGDTASGATATEGASSSAENSVSAKPPTEQKASGEVAPLPGAAKPSVPPKKSWAAEQLARKVATTRTGITGHNLPAVQLEKLTKTGDQAKVEIPKEPSEPAVSESVTPASEGKPEEEKPPEAQAPQSSAPAKGPDSQPAPPEAKAKLFDLKAKLAASSGKTPAANAQSSDTTAKPPEIASQPPVSGPKASDLMATPPDVSAKTSNPRNTSTLLNSLRSSSPIPKERSKDGDSAKSTRTIEMASAQSAEEEEKKQFRRTVRNIGFAGAGLLVLTIMFFGFSALDEKSKADQVTALYEKARKNEIPWKEVVDRATEALQWHPRSAELLFYRGRALRCLKEPQKALDDFNSALNISPNDYRIIERRAFAQLDLNNNQGAIADFARLLEKKEYQKPENYSLRGTAYLSTADFVDAAKDFRLAGQGNPKNVAYLLCLAMAETGMRHYGKAIDALNQALKADPKNTAAYLQQARIFVLQKQYAQAKSVLAKCNDIRPAPAAYAMLAEIAIQERDIPGALRAYNKVLSLHQDDPLTLSLRAQLYLDSGKPAIALDDYNRIAKVNGIAKVPDFYRKKANVEKRLGQMETATSDYAKAVAANGQDGWLSQQLADCAESIGDYKTAVGAYSKSIERRPNESWLYVKRGLAYSNNKNYTDADADFQKAVSLDNNNVGAYFGRGLNCFRSGLYDRATVDFDKVLAMDHNYPEARKLKAQIASIKNHGTVLDTSSSESAAAPKDPELEKCTSKTELVDKGYSKMKEGQSAAAIPYFAKAIKLDPNCVDARRDLGYALLNQGRPAAAIEQFNILERIKPMTDVERLALAKSLTDVDAKKEAVDVYKKYLKTHPGEADPREELVKLYEALGQFDQLQDVCVEGMKQAKTPEDYATFKKLMVDAITTHNSRQLDKRAGQNIKGG